MIIHAQQDTNLVSLSVGNKWYWFTGIYSGFDDNRGIDPRMNAYFYEEIRKDTTIASKRYAVIFNSFLNQQRYERADSRNLYGWSNGEEFRKLSFDAQRNDTLKSLITASQRGIPLIFDNYTFRFKTRGVDGPGKSFIRLDTSILIRSLRDTVVFASFARRFGLIETSISSRSGFSSGVFLHAARIDGQLFGDTLFGQPKVGVTLPPPVTTALAIPNPFSESLQYSFQLYAPADVAVSVINTATGTVVRSLPAQTLASGKHSSIWDGRDNDGKTAPAGAYIVQVYANDKPLATAKVIKQ
jgi:hypothetical protein